MRKLLNILAVIVGLMSAFAAVSGGVIFVSTMAVLFRESGSKPDSAGFYLLALGGVFAFLGGLIASRAWLHLRKPDAGTARDMIGTALYIIAALVVYPLIKGSGLFLPFIVGLYLFHRFLAKRVAAQAFPVPESNV